MVIGTRYYNMENAMEPVSLRPYQQIAIHDVRKCFGDGLKRVMVYSPTGIDCYPTEERLI